MNHKTKKIISYILSVGIIAAAAIWVAGYFYHGHNVEYTDNARVKQQIVPVISRVQGYVKEIRFKEFEPVRKGDTLVIIDDSDLKLNVARARADYQNALAGRSVADENVGVAAANDAVSDAAIEEARVVMELASTDLERYRNLLSREAVTCREYDAVETDYKAKCARYETLRRQKTASASVVGQTRTRIAQSDAGIDLARAQLETAELNLSYTVITAPCDGYASRKEIQTGQLVNPGQKLLDLVDTSDVWVTANFKETQLPHISVGSEVEITVDGLDDAKLTGHVNSISQATGSAVSMLPQDNSAGNFVKVRQRVPVRITLDKENDKTLMRKLRAGMNVECRIKY